MISSRSPALVLEMAYHVVKLIPLTARTVTALGFRRATGRPMALPFGALEVFVGPLGRPLTSPAMLSRRKVADKNRATSEIRTRSD